jgi:neutral ceramidase
MRNLLPLGLAVLLVVCVPQDSAAADKAFRAGAFAIDITPLELPVLVNGNMNPVLADTVNDRLHARCLVLDDGTNQAAIVIVDSCMLPRTLLDEAKELASKATGIPTNHMLISATHAHSAPSSHGCLGTDPDPKYVHFLPPQIAKGIALAQKNLALARIGWGMGRDEKNVANRHWVMKPGIAPKNRFGGTKDDTVMMHPGHNNPNAIRAAGPVDPDVPVVSLQTPDGKPVAVLSAYSLHYVGAKALSADYFAVFCDKLTAKLGVLEATKKTGPPFMAALANATSGDTWLMDYSQKERRKYDLEGVAEDVSSAAFAAYKKISYFDWAPLVMEEKLMTVGVRMPSAEEVAAAKEMVKTIEKGKPMSLEQIYARETLLLNDLPPTRELKLQAIRIGDMGIGTIPNEVYGSTGLNIKKDSPIKTTFVIELANGCEGYLPTPELLKLGGYTCWRARTSCLESEAEPKIRAAVMELLGKVAKERTDEKMVASKRP